MSLTVWNPTRKFHVDGVHMLRILAGVVDAAGYRGWSVGLRIANDARIRELNGEYRGKWKPTDILSFANREFVAPEVLRVESSAGSAGGVEVVEEEEEDRDLGDMVVSFPYIHRVCAAEGLDVEDHWRTLLIHGVCHLVGYDHENDADFATMQAKEDAVRRLVDARMPTRDAVERAVHTLPTRKNQRTTKWVLEWSDLERR